MKFVQSILKKLIKSWVIVLICMVLAAISSYSLFNHYRSFSFLHSNGMVYRIESFLLDLRLRIRGPIKPSGKVGILAIDEKALDKFGSYPFSRRYYAQAFKNLKKLGVSWIGFDAIFAEPQKAYLEDAQKSLDLIGADGKPAANLSAKIKDLTHMMKVSPGDEIFANGIKDFGNIVLGYFFFGSKTEAQINLQNKPRFPRLDRMLSSEIGAELPSGKTLKDYFHLKKAHGIVSNIDLISNASEQFAFFSNDADDDAINRWVNLLANIDGHLMPSLSLKTVAEYLNREILVLFDDRTIESIMLVNRDNQNDAIELPIDPLGAGRMLANHIGPGRSFHHYSVADAYSNTYSKEEIKNLKGSVLLLGATATGMNDIRPNPFDPSIDGVENHAAIMENIVTKNFLKRPVDIYGIEMTIVIAIALLFCPIMIFANSLSSGIAVLIFLIGYYYVDKFLWFGKGTWAYLAIPSLEIISMFITTTLYKYMTEEAEKKKVKGAFQHYLSPDVIDQVLDDPESLQLGGEKKELTVFFSDVRSFTTISESLTPEKLCELMNDYFTPMTSIILRSKGVLDKYIGDAIMAFWGAPINLPNSPDIAVRASVEMLYALDKLRSDFDQKGFPRIDIGIGLNTGPMSVGNMGSAERFTYTVMGDSVNLGARLEGLTKEYGIKILISEFTAAKLTPNTHFIRNLDDIRVKGKNEPVNVFDVMRPDFLPQEAMIREFIGHFEEGRKLYKMQKFEQAMTAFRTCLMMKPDDKSSELYVERLNEYIANRPGENWDGVYTFTHK